MHTKQAPYRTYVVGARIPKDSVPQALYWDTSDPYHYVRLQSLNAREDSASIGFSIYVSRFSDVGALYGAFTGAILLLIWLWLTNVALLFGAELNAEIERQKELSEGVPHADTLNRPPARG